MEILKRGKNHRSPAGAKGTCKSCGCEVRLEASDKDKVTPRTNGILAPVLVYFELKCPEEGCGGTIEAYHQAEEEEANRWDKLRGLLPRDYWLGVTPGGELIARQTPSPVDLTPKIDWRITRATGAMEEPSEVALRAEP